MMYTGTYGIAVSLALKDGKNPVDLTGYTSAKFVIVGPEGRTEKSATVPQPVDGEVQYITQAGDFGEEAHYKLQAVVDFGPSKRLRSEVVSIEVKKAL